MYVRMCACIYVSVRFFLANLTRTSTNMALDRRHCVFVVLCTAFVAVAVIIIIISLE
jgi:hypothetical protein